MGLGGGGGEGGGVEGVWGVWGEGFVFFSFFGGGIGLECGVPTNCWICFPGFLCVGKLLIFFVFFEYLVALLLDPPGGKRGSFDCLWMC